MSTRRRGQSVSVQLFPFLAVLLCAMGGLIMLLVIITDKNRKVGKVLGDVALQERVALAEKRNELEWQLEFVSGARDNTANQLASRRAALAMLEEQLRTTRDEIAELEAAAQQLQKSQHTESLNAVDIESQIARIEREASDKEVEVKRIKQAIQHFEGSYAVVPYEGPHSTRRRPIYIECVADAVIMQPENIRLSENDFVFSDGPKNPLASALRTARDYLVKNRYVGGVDNGDPYPLLLVRPDGIGAYYAARHAMTSWGAEFGYELVDKDWKISYRPSDPGLIVAMNRAVDDARRHGAEIARSAPGLLDAEQRRLYRSAFSGGKLGGGGGTGMAGGSGMGDRGGYSGAGSSGRGGTRGSTRAASLSGGGSGTGSSSGAFAVRGPGRGAGGDGSGSGYGGSPGSYGGSATGDDPSTLPYGNIANGNGSGRGYAAAGGSGDAVGNNAVAMNSGMGPSRAGGAAGGEYAHGSESGGTGTAGSNTNSPGNTYGGIANSGANGNNSGNTSASGGTGGSASGANASSANGTGTGSSSGRNGSAGGSSSGSQGSSGSSSGSSSSGGSSGNGGSASAGGSSGGSGQSGQAGANGGGQPSLSVTASNPQQNHERPQSMAKRRGRDWSVPEKVRSAVPLTRPISVRVTASEITFLSETGNPLANKSVPLKDRTEDSVDELVHKVWDQVNSWNLAGDGMYWRPVIVAHVTPDGQQRFHDLEALLHDSGLDVKHKATITTRPQTRR